MTPANPTPPHTTRTHHDRAFARFDPHQARGRMLLGLSLGVGAATLLPASLSWEVRACVGWDVAATILLALSWSIILRSDAAATARRVTSQDPGRRVAWALSLASSTFSLFAAVGILRHVKDQPGVASDVLVGVCLYAVASAWTLTQTSYTLRYARLFYRGEQGCGEGSSGLQFPAALGQVQADPPSDIDFAYFAFTLGMCFQTSDVTITNTAFRRAVLGHAVLSFVYNTVILALALNLTFGLAG